MPGTKGKRKAPATKKDAKNTWKKQTGKPQGVTKPTQSKSTSTLKAAEKAAPSKKAPKARNVKEKASGSHEVSPITPAGAKEMSTAVNGLKHNGFLAINSTNPNPARVIAVPRPKARFILKDKDENVGIISADIGNWTTIVAWALGNDTPETFDYWKGAAAQRHKEIRTRAVARKKDDGEWHLEFGPDTDVVCEEEGEVVVFDNLKLSMNPASKYFEQRREKERKIRMENISQRYIEWVFRTIFEAAKLANPKIESFLVYTALPARWPEDVYSKYKKIIRNISGWENKVEVSITSEPSVAAIGRLKSLKVEQRGELGLYLQDDDHAGILDVGDSTANLAIMSSESYQPVDGATALLGFGILNRIVEDILRPSEWLRTTFGNESASFLQQWMQTTFLTKYKPMLGGGRQNELEIHNKKVPEDLANRIEEAVLRHFDRVINVTLKFFNTWSETTGIELKWLATSGGGCGSKPFQSRINGRAEPYRIFHNPEYACGEDVLDGLMQQPHLHSTFQYYPCSYGLGHDLDSAPVGESEKPQHVLVFAEKRQPVPKLIRSIPYYIQEPPDGKWEINLTVLKSGEDLSGVEPEKGLGHKVVSSKGWTELPSHNIEIPFDTSKTDFGIPRHDDKGQPTHREACVYLLLELRGIEFVVHAMGGWDGKESVSFRNLHTAKRQGYQVNGFDDKAKYFHVVTSTAIRILEGTDADPIDLEMDD